MPKLTLDHNVVIDLANNSPRVTRLRSMLSDDSVDAYIVEIGASEMRQVGIKPDRYDLFELLLSQAGLADLPRLAPMMIWNVTFWDHAVWSDDQTEMEAKQIEGILFGESKPIDISNEPEDSKEHATWLNRICDIQSMWCHIHHQNDVFVTSDRNFHKATKTPSLLALGAGRIAWPDEL